MPKKNIYGEFYCIILLKKTLQLKHIEFLLRLTATMLYPKQCADIGFDALTIMLLMLKIKNALANRKSEDEELEAILQMIQKQGH